LPAPTAPQGHVTPRPASELRNDDETPISFEEDEHLELPDDKPNKGASKPPSATKDLLDIRGPSPLVSSSAAAPSATQASHQPAKSDTAHLKSFRLFKGQDGFGFSVHGGAGPTGVSVKGVKDGGVAHKAGIQVRVYQNLFSSDLSRRLAMS
jgi:hypothetical protein